MTEQLARLPELLTAHLELTLLALLFSTAISVPAGILSARVAWLEQSILGLAGVIQTIPGLALLAVMVPLLAALHLQSIGFLPAIIGLTLYGLLPILRNTVTGIVQVDPALGEAARGVGMTAAQQLRWVEVPLALPVIIAGVRTATVWIVGMATLSTPVGAASLGNYIFAGLQTRNFRAVLVGSAAAAALALALDGLVRSLEVGIRLRRRGRTLAAAIGFAVLYGYVGVSLTLGSPGGSGASRAVTIGAKTFTEQYILSHLLAAQIERTTGRDTRVLESLGSTVAFDALRSGALDVYVEYSGTLWATLLNRTTVPDERGTVLREVTRYLADEHDIEVVGPLGFENAYALAMRAGEAAALGVATISDLAAHAPRLSIGGDYEFFARPEWGALEETYRLSFAARRTMDPSLMYQAAGQGTVDVISAFTTDGRVDAYELRILEDDRGAIPPYDAIVLAGPSLQDRPDVIAALRELIGTIGPEAMRALNLAVDQEGRTPETVAEEFLSRLNP